MLEVQVEIRVFDPQVGDGSAGIHIVEETAMGTGSDIRRLARRAVGRAEAALVAGPASDALRDESEADSEVPR